jgi:hypothetical protein
LREHGVDAWCLRETALDLNDTEAKPTDKGKGAQ